MNKLKKRSVDRIVAFILVIVIVSGFVPADIMAESTEGETETSQEGGTESGSDETIEGGDEGEAEEENTEETDDGSEEDLDKLTFTFKVTEKDEGTPIEGASIELEYKDKENNWTKCEPTGTTDDEGKFEFKDLDPKYEYRYRVSCYGYVQIKEEEINREENDKLNSAVNIELKKEKYQVTFAAQLKDGGSIKLDDKDLEFANEHYDDCTKVLQEGSEVNLKVKPNEGYRIAQIKIEYYSEDVNECFNELTEFDQNISIKSNMRITIVFEKIYTITVIYNEDGTVELCSENEEDNKKIESGNVIVVNEGSDQKIIAKPNEGYKVCKVKIINYLNNNNKVILDKDFTDNTYDKDNPYEIELAKVVNVEGKDNYKIEITFSPKVYNVTINTDGNARVVGPNGEMGDFFQVEHGSTPKISIIQDEGYHVSEVTVNGEDGIESLVEDENNINHLTYELDEVKKNTEINIKFKKIEVIPKSELDNVFKNDYYKISFYEKVNGEPLELEDSEILREYTEGLYTVIVLPQNTSIELVPQGNFNRIRLNQGWINYKSIIKGSNVIIEKITVDEKVGFYSIESKWIPAKLKIVFDNDAPKITVENNNNIIYSENFDVNIEVNDPDFSAGLESVYYTITTDESEGPTQEGNLYTYNSLEEIETSFKGKIEVDAEKNNSENVKLCVTAIDRSGNKVSQEQTYSINAIHPKASLSIDGEKHPESKDDGPYYNKKRTATITIVDADYTFDEGAANDAIKISKSCQVDDDMQEISAEEKSKMVSGWTHTRNENGKDVYTATVVFSESARYKWSFDEYSNKAGLTNDSPEVDSEDNKDLYEFVIDTESPEGWIYIGKESIWDKILEFLTFGLWKNDNVTVEAKGEDNLSPACDIQYYKYVLTAEEDLPDVGQLEDFFQDGELTNEPITVDKEEQFVVYARITDYAGNTTYVSTEDIGIDKTLSEITLNITNETEEGIDIHNKDVVVEVEVNDKVDKDKECSGIKEITYEVLKGENYEEQTQKGTLYSKRVNDNGDALDFWDGTIAVNADLNNSDDIKLVVTVFDNAGNKSTSELNLMINIDKPTVSIEFDNNEANKIVDGKGYYNEKRVATISVKDRATAFDGEKLIEGIDIDAIDSSGDPIDIDINDMISDWTHSKNDNNEDIHIAEITFEADANYILSIDYTNKANNSMEELKSDSYTPFDFIIDRKAPTGSITVVDLSQEDSTIKNTFNKLLEILTFGSYSNKQFNVLATAQDDTSPIIVEYYKTDNYKAMSKDELDDIAEKQLFNKINDEKVDTNEEFHLINVEPNEQFVVYLKISDYAGNYTYISTDGYIVDNVASEIELAFDKANSYNIYNQDVNVSIQVTDKVPYSGIKTVDYKVVKDGDEDKPTQEGNIFTFNLEQPTQEQLVREYKKSITIDAAKNNSSDVVLYVRTEDNAGNVNIVKSDPIDIDVTAPSIDITYNNNKDNNGNSYFAAKRTATVTITERPNHFDQNDATKEIKIIAKDLKGNSINDSYTISNWKTVVNKSNPDKSTHTATISFNKDANYNFSIGYTDKAGNVNSTVKTNNSVAPYKFTVDTTAPTGMIKAVSAEGRTEEWDKLCNSLRFGYWSNKKIGISSTSSDMTSPIATVEYYKHVSKNAKDATKALTVKELDNIKTWSEFKGFEVSSNEQFTVYLKVTDKAGNYTYISTNGLIVDNTRPVTETIAPEIALRPQQPINGIYKGDVRVSIEVEDPIKGGTYSGLKEVSYEVYNRAVSQTRPTQSGTLFTFNNKNPKQSDLVKNYNGSIIVDSSLNNSNDIEIVVTAVDNSLNSSDKSNSIKIDTTAPRINISYDNNNPENNTFFKDNRTATIVVTERNFNPDDVNINITNRNGTTPTVSAWRKSDGSGNLDDTRWTANITYSADGDYSFDIGYTDLAGNVCRQINYASSTVAGEEFTIDKTIPLINVSYDNNSAKNTNFYKEGRRATITIIERNFNASGVEIDLTASDDGRPSSLPTISGWSSNGDRHTATINYVDDGLYSFDIRYTDQAANVAEKFQKQTFYVDKTKPSLKITGVNNNSANSGVVIPVITCSDTNFDDNQLKITLVGANRNEVAIEGSYSDIHNGKIFTFKNFDNKKEIDDIYSLTATLTDKAGNSTTETINFSINRFGSNYILEDSAKELNGRYVTEAGDLIISEINADKLKDIIITLYKNEQTIILTEDKDYKIDIEGGDGSWYKYTYTIFKENFKDDGIYRIEIESKDQAGNVAVNTLDTKNMQISFAVDSTPPNIIVANLSDNETYAVDNLLVSLSANDNLKLASLEVYLNGSEHASWSGEELEKIITEAGNFEFEIPGDSTKAHTIKIVATDQAGHETIKEIKGFYVTTNLWVRFITNKNLVYGVIASGTLFIALIILIIVWRKRKNNV